MKGKSLRALRPQHVLKCKALPLAISSIVLGFAGNAWGQATSGTIYGTVPAVAGESVQITGGSGFNRTVDVGTSGKYSVTLPVGTYTVSLLQDGKVVDTRSGVSPVAAGAVAVDFAVPTAGANANARTLGTINVTGNSLPPIDVSTTNQVTTITAKQLQQLPIQRTAEDIALLAPGVNLGSPEIGTGPLGTPNLVFGGASTAENAYYLDGMNTTELLNNQGGISLPYGAIEQQQTFTSGYDARYGRSIGGVINQIGKSGDNEWHFGARALWQPGSLRDDPDNYYYANPLVTSEGNRPGDLAVYRKNNSSSETIYDAYVSGPLIKDKLFFYIGLEQDDSHYRSTSEFSSTGTQETFKVHDPKFYTKFNWNINDSNVLSASYVQNSHKTAGTIYDFDYDTLKTGDFNSLDQINRTTFKVWSANYTSYITDNLTLNAMAGKMHGSYYTAQPGYPGYDPLLPHIASSSVQDPAFVPPGGISNSQINSSITDSRHKESVTNYRLNLDYKLGDHDFQVGIDNINSEDLNDGSVNPGPGYQWIYGQSDPGSPVFGVDPNVPPYVAPSTQCHPDSTGTVRCYFVQKHTDISVASVRVQQRAQYVMDNWQVTPTFLLNLGLRNDQFTNYDASGVPYIRLTTPQWAPRLGFSWDVHGDSSLKVFGNAGRYYLALPEQVALSIAAPVTNAGIYGTYTGIDPTTGAPIGFTPLPQNPSTGVSIDSEYGQPKDPRVSASRNIKAEYSDNYVLGMQQQFQMLGTQWVFGATGTYQRMNRIIDDFDDIQIECAAGRAQGYAYMTADTCSQWAQSLVLINPGETSNLWMQSPSGALVPVTLSAKDQGFPKGPTRRYYSLDLSLEHAWDGKWFAKLDYVFSRTWGNDEGPVSTYSQQGGSYESLTTGWDFPERMEYSSGVLPNDRRHQIKLFGAYQVAPDWTLGANLYIASGTPVLCRGGYGPNQLALHGSHTYYWCGGEPVPPGSLGRLPWTHQVGLNVDYKPGWADHKLDFNLAVFNLLDQQTPVFYNDFYGTTSSPNPDFGRVQDTLSPRYVRFSVAYDF
ncbi:MAG TPA: TonB-dependent receptor plug domain-containing protein [Dyella sp.]|uniref:TonB-dependent receptor n=1 Tax=Dyella sp. TaxID=1869338 RepID=UPI002D79D7C6|nr:TonB-dependent receptor plug domain-containing protein [Dyella sp.]HET6552143.1 TonB-dependent receptor plug domain-containing protein [Dyella sp.]